MVQRHAKALRLGNLLGGVGAALILVLSFSFGQLLDRVVANVNGEPILESEVKIASIFYGIKDREEIIKKLVEKHLIVQFLKEKGLKVPEGYIESLIRDIAKSNKKSVEEFYRDLYSEGLTPKDLKDFLRIEVASTLGLKEFLKSKIEVSEVEIELERLKKGEIKFLREIELLVVDKERKEDLLKVMEVGIDLNRIARALDLKTEKLKVGRGDLVEPLDKEVWRVKPGDLAVAEDEKHIYIAKVVRVIREISGRSEDEIRKEIIERKMKEIEREIITRLMKNGFVEVYG